MTPNDRDPPTPPSPTADRSGSRQAGEEWCAVLDNFGLDLEQAEALTRATAERAAMWAARLTEVLPVTRLSELLSDRPTHPDTLHQGLELYRQRKGFDDV